MSVVDRFDIDDDKSINFQEFYEGYDDVTYVYDDVTYVYDDVTYVYDDVTYVYDDMMMTRASTFRSSTKGMMM